MSEPVSFGPYRVLRPLARGGMAQLLLARKEGPGGFAKLVAVKQVLPHHASNADFVKMFLDEARIAAQLDHPNIVHVQDFGEAGGTYYLAMEYLQGRDLATLLRAGPVPPVIAALIGSAACSGLHYAHTLTRDDGTPLKVVHRDISPSNIFLTLQGAVKVLDFGIAKAEGKLSETKAGGLKGKPLYMSPEQIWSKPLDARSDVWAMGVVLYELVSGSKPFERESERAILEAIEKEPPAPLRAVRPDVPKGFEDLVFKCLEKATERRYQSAQELRRALDGFVAAFTSAPPQGQLQEFIEALVPPAERTPAPGPPPRRVDAQAAVATLLRPDDPPATQALPSKTASPQPRSATRILSLVVLLIGGTGVAAFWLFADEPQPPQPVPVAARPKPTPGPASPPAPEVVEKVVVPVEPPVEEPAPNPKPKARAQAAPTPPAAQKPAATGKLKVTCAPFGQLFIDGSPSGDVAPQRVVDLEAGTHQVKCVHPELGEARTEVSVTAGQLSEKRLTY